MAKLKDECEITAPFRTDENLIEADPLYGRRGPDTEPAFAGRYNYGKFTPRKYVRGKETRENIYTLK